MNKSLLRCVSILGFAVILLISGCASSQKPVARFHIKALVSDFEVMDDIPEEIKELKGWWFGSRDVYMNENVGEIFSDVLARNLNKDISNLDIYSRTDYKYYMANKKDKLKKAYPKLSNDQIDQLFIEIPVTDFAGDLQLDKVILGKINECKTVHNRTSHWWSSLIDADVSIIDVSTGEVEWKGNVRVKKNFSSQYGAMEKAADILNNLMKKEYFYK